MKTSTEIPKCTKREIKGNLTIDNLFREDALNQIKNALKQVSNGIYNF